LRHCWRAIRASHPDQQIRSGKSGGGGQFATWTAKEVSFANDFTGWKCFPKNCQVGLLFCRYKDYDLEVGQR
jgi:hypothetical protein